MDPVVQRRTSLRMTFAACDTAARAGSQRRSAVTSRSSFANSTRPAHSTHNDNPIFTTTTTAMAMTAQGFCEEEVGILSHLLLDDHTLGAEEYFPTFPPSSFFPGTQRGGGAPISAVHEFFGHDLLAPLDAAELSFMRLHGGQAQQTAAMPAPSSQAHMNCLPHSPSPKPRGRVRSAIRNAQRKAGVSGTGTGNGRICSTPGCEKSSQSRGRCIRHGGGKRCSVKDCARGAQATGRCKAHGGGVRCSVTGCEKSSQGSGLCRTHGGGKICEFPGCKKGTQRGGKCSTHGGARLCAVDGCGKVDRGGGLCGTHKKTMVTTLLVTTSET